MSKVRLLHIFTLDDVLQQEIPENIEESELIQEQTKFENMITTKSNRINEIYCQGCKNTVEI